MYLSETTAASSDPSSRFLSYDVKPKKHHIQKLHKAHTSAKQIRLFVSSTFLYVIFAFKLITRDMVEERAVLVSDVFPQIKKVCRQRNINFVYVGASV